jgi:O-antigen/teichoic acid export membrane protein
LIRDFIKEGSLYAIAIAAAKGISLLLVPVFTYYFATKDFGVLEILNVVAFLATGLFSWQFGQGIVRYLGAEKNHQLRRKYLASTALIFVIGSFAIGTALLVLFRSSVLNAIGLTNPVYEKTFILAMCTMFFNGIFFFLASHMQALRKKNAYALSLFLHAFLGISATYFFVIVLDKSVNGYFYATLVTTPTVILLQFKVLWSEFVFGFSKTILIQLLKFSAPLVPSTLALVLLSVIDRIILNDLTSTSTLGIYSIGVKFAFGLQLLVQGYATAINPLIFEGHKDERTPVQLSILFRGYIVLGSVVIAVLTLFAKETIYFFAHSPYHSAYLVLPMLYGTAWLHGLIMFAPGMQIKNKTLYIT